MSKTLILVRHAKSSWKNTSLEDRDRPLNRRGQNDAPMMGQRLSQSGVLPDLIISSPAQRALSTARIIATEIGYPLDNIESEAALYFKGIEEILKLIHETKPQRQSLMLVAHNPDLTELLNLLCGFQTENLPTCAVATLSLSDWRHTGGASLKAYDYPKNPNPSVSP